MGKNAGFVISEVLSRIGSLDGDVQAWVHLDPQGPAPATDLPLSDLAVGIKDVIDVRGMPTRAGSPILADAAPAAADARAVALLRAAGAMIPGKTATTVFAFYDPVATRNPRNTGHTPGGSSSGSAAAVAAGMCDAALGTQTQGSVIRPAAFCGVFGLKPTYEAISRAGVLPLAESLDHVGLFTRSAAVAARLAEVLFEAHFAGERPGTVASETFVERRERLGRPRVGVPDRYFTQIADDTVRHGYRDGLTALSLAGFHLEPMELPASFEAAMEAAGVILRVEAAAFHQRWYSEHREAYGSKLAGVLEAGAAISGIDYYRARRLQQEAGRDMLACLEQVDFVATPSAPTVAPEGLGWTGDPVFNTPFSLFGLPAINLPASYAPNGLCSGFQLAGRPCSEARLLRLALTLEESGFGRFVAPGALSSDQG